MADYDFSGVTNPKRNIERRMDEAGEGSDIAPGPAKKTMSQADFSYGRKREHPKKQQKLIDALRARDSKHFGASGY